MACSKPSYFNPNDRKDHEQNLEKLCIKCGDRFGKKGKLLDDKLKKLVEKWLYPNYFRDEKYLPKSCCDGWIHYWNIEQEKVVINFANSEYASIPVWIMGDFPDLC